MTNSLCCAAHWTVGQGTDVKPCMSLYTLCVTTAIAVEYSDCQYHPAKLEHYHNDSDSGKFAVQSWVAIGHERTCSSSLDVHDIVLSHQQQKL